MNPEQIKQEQERVNKLLEGTIKPGDMVVATMPANRTSWMFADYCTSTDTPVKDGEVGILLARTADRKAENYSVRLLGRDHDVVFNIAELKPAAHAEALEQDRWIPVEERLPDDEDERVLVATQVQKFGGVQRSETVGFFCEDGGGGFFIVHEDMNGVSRVYGLNHLRNWQKVVTHWRPLPPPPTQEARNE